MWLFLLACDSKDLASDCAHDSAAAHGDSAPDSGESDSTPPDSGPDSAGDTSDPADDTSAGDTGDTGEVDPPPPDQVADFVLVDENPNSPSCGAALSPRDYLEQVSGWYFVHST